MRPLRAALVAAAAMSVAALGITVPLQQASSGVAYASLRLVDPLPAGDNSVDLTTAVAGQPWLANYAPGLRLLFMYRNVGSTFNLTYEARDASGSLLKDTPVYLIVNKYYSCSDATFTTTVDTLYAGTQANMKVIPRDWCGSTPAKFGGESPIPGVTGSDGRATFTLTNTNLVADAEVAPLAKNVINDYTKSGTRTLQCADDPKCLKGDITASFFPHPAMAVPADDPNYAKVGAMYIPDQHENKDLITLHIANNGLAAEKQTQYGLSGTGTQVVRVRSVDLDGNPVPNVPVSFFTNSGPDEADLAVAPGDANGSVYQGVVSTATDASGWASATATITDGAVGDQRITATINGTSVSAKTAVSWVTAIPAPVVKPAVSKAATLSGTAKVGASLTLTAGTWLNSPTAKTYAWYLCTANGAATTSVPKTCVAVKGASAASWKITTAAKGKYIRAAVTAKNSAGSAMSVTSATAKVQ